MLQKRSEPIKAEGFYFFLTAQFLSALADNALLFAAIALLSKLEAPNWHQPLLLQFFVLAYIVLAPFVGAFADSRPKGQVMFMSNGVKLFGCIAMLLGMQPLYAYAIVGIGAAAYSPAKYGILTELLPEKSLVQANAWVEGLTVAAIIFGEGWVSANGMYLAIASLTGVKKSSPASTTPPPIIIASGSSKSVYEAIALPSQSAQVLNAEIAILLLDCAALVSTEPVKPLSVPSPKFNKS